MPFFRKVPVGKAVFSACRETKNHHYHAAPQREGEVNGREDTHLDGWGGHQTPRKKLEKDDDGGMDDTRSSVALWVDAKTVART